MRTHFDPNQQLVDQYLFHSFLYYQLDESLVSDSQYDQLVNQLKNACPEIWEHELEFADLAQKGLKSGAHTMTKYPSLIVSSAIQLIYYQKHVKIASFDEYLSRLGYCIST